MRKTTGERGNSLPYMKLSHDLRNPLAAMRLNLDLLNQSIGTELNKSMFKRYIDNIDKEIDKMVKILSEYKE